MDYTFLADATAITHISIIVAVIVGLLVSFRYKRFRPWEAGALLSVVVLWSYYGNCPLTILEQYFREAAGESVNLTAVGFLPYYAQHLLDLSLSSKIVQHSTFFTGGVLFTASIEWLSPFMHMEIFKMRRFLRRIFRIGHRRKYA